MYGWPKWGYFLPKIRVLFHIFEKGQSRPPTLPSPSLDAWLPWRGEETYLRNRFRPVCPNKRIMFMLIARPDSKWKNLDQTSFLIISFFLPHINFGCVHLISYIKYVSFHSPLRGVIYHILFSRWLWLRRRFVFGGEIW